MAIEDKQIEDKNNEVLRLQQDIDKKVVILVIFSNYVLKWIN
jgi:hypothetical protein